MVAVDVRRHPLSPPPPLPFWNELGRNSGGQTAFCYWTFRCAVGHAESTLSLVSFHPRTEPGRPELGSSRPPQDSSGGQSLLSLPLPLTGLARTCRPSLPRAPSFSHPFCRCQICIWVCVLSLLPSAAFALCLLPWLSPQKIACMSTSSLVSDLWSTQRVRESWSD